MIYVIPGLPASLSDDSAYLAAKAAALAEAGVDPVEAQMTPSLSVLCRPSGYWNNTGVYKPKGVALVVSLISGTWQSNPYWGPVDGAGNSRYIAGPTYLCPGVPEGTLIGKIGGNSVEGGSATFAIGNYGFVPPDLEGLLWLTVNDEPRGFGDNKGSLQVTVNIPGQNNFG